MTHDGANWQAVIQGGTDGSVAVGTSVLNPTTGLTAPNFSVSVPPMIFSPLSNINPVLWGADTSHDLKDPAVYTDAANDRLLAWYSFGKDNVTVWDIAYAKTSSQTKFDFVHQAVAVAHNLNGACDALGAVGPSVPILSGGVYYLFYTGIPNRGGASIGLDAPWNICLATASSLTGPWAAGGMILDGTTQGHSLAQSLLGPAESPDGKWHMYLSQAPSGSGSGFRVVSHYTSMSPGSGWARAAIPTAFDPRVDAGTDTTGWQGDVETPVVFIRGKFCWMAVDDAEHQTNVLAVSTDGCNTFKQIDNRRWLSYAGPNRFDTQGSDALRPFQVLGREFAMYQSMGANVNWGLSVGEIGRDQQYPRVGKFQSIRMTGISADYVSSSPGDVTNTAWVVNIGNSGKLVVDLDADINFNNGSGGNVASGEALVWITIDSTAQQVKVLSGDSASGHTIHMRSVIDTSAITNGLHTLKIRAQIIAGTGCTVGTTCTMHLSEMEWSAEEKVIY